MLQSWQLLLCKQIDYASPKCDQRKYNAKDDFIEVHLADFLAWVAGVGGMIRNRNAICPWRYTGRLI